MARIFGDPDEIGREGVVENAVDWLSNGGEYYEREVYDEYGEWLFEALRDDERVNYHEGYKSFAHMDALTPDGPGICKCDSPEVVRTLAKGTPAEKKYCSCGGRVRE